MDSLKPVLFGILGLICFALGEAVAHEMLSAWVAGVVVGVSSVATFHIAERWGRKA